MAGESGEMEKQREWDQRKWRVVADGGQICRAVMNCKTRIGAYYTALVLKYVFGASVLVFHREERTLEDAMTELLDRNK